MSKRRDLIKGALGLPFLGTLMPMGKTDHSHSKGDFERDYFKELGLRTFINAAGTLYCIDCFIASSGGD
jgi:L-seryl-tRNA(Ser) seleniumtransferase